MSIEELMIDIGKKQREENFEKNLEQLRDFISFEKQKETKKRKKIKNVLFQILI